MAVKFVILVALALCASKVQADNIRTFASTYNAHSINHAVAYPVRSSKGAVPSLAVTPAIIATAPAVPPAPAIFAASVPAATSSPSLNPTTTVPPASNAIPTPASAQTPTGAQSSSPANAPAYIPFPVHAQGIFAATPYGFAAPAKITFVTGSTYDPDHATVPAYSVAPAYATAPAYTTAPTATPAYAPVTFTFPGLSTNAPAPVTFTATPSKLVFTVPNFVAAPNPFAFANTS